MIEEAGAHFYKMMKITSKRAGEIAWILIYPLISIFSLGLFAYFMSLEGAPPESMIFILVGVIVWDIYGVAQRAPSYGITLDIWSDCLKHTFTGSSSLTGFVIGTALFGLFSTIAVLIIMGVISYLVFGFNILLAGVYLLNILGVFIFATAFALIVNSLMLTQGEKYMSLIWITPGIMLVLSGIYYPIELLPGPVQAASMVIPTTHSLISMRAAFGFAPEQAFPELVTGMILSVAYLAACLLIFKWSLHRSKVSGLITKH